jgi:hypothetical protein
VAYILKRQSPETLGRASQPLRLAAPQGTPRTGGKAATRGKTKKKKLAYLSRTERA